MSTAKVLVRGLRSLRHTSTTTPWHRSFSISSTSRNAHLNAHRKFVTPFRTRAVLSNSTIRHFSTSPIQQHGHITPPKPGEELYITFVDKEGKEHKIAVSEGDNLLDIAQANDLEMEGACGGSCACSTCHVIVLDEAYYDRMPEPNDDENDMLDLAFGLTETSRLGCQVVMKKELDGLKVKLPSMTRNLQASDFTPTK
ncbi:adrenodoxin-like protein, mitochondrial precursor [Xylaria sp. CBS 124048]|nr:adrenodoxin-like protein, mitochondrial precursor [Xylaria sp. CBS 124048]